MPSTVDDHRREHALLVSYLRYRGFREHIADEAASNALAEAWRKAISGKGRMSWLFKVAKRMASRETRHDPATRLAAKGYQPPDARSDGTEAFRAAERVIDLRTAMRELDEREQQVMTLHLHLVSGPSHTNRPPRTDGVRDGRASPSARRRQSRETCVSNPMGWRIRSSPASSCTSAWIRLSSPKRRSSTGMAEFPCGSPDTSRPSTRTEKYLTRSGMADR